MRVHRYRPVGSLARTIAGDVRYDMREAGYSCSCCCALLRAIPDLVAAVQYIGVPLYCRFYRGPVIGIMPVKSVGTDGINHCGSVQNNAGARFNAGVSAWHIPAL